MSPPLAPGSLFIRADAGKRMGLGHMMRCLALAQAWKVRGGQVKLLTHPVVPSLDRRMQEEGLELHPLEKACGSIDEALEVASLASRCKADWLVLDGYHFTPAYRAALKGARYHLLIVDDLADTDLSAADIVLNQNVYAEPSMYSSTLRLLLGSEYALLRREFLPWRGKRAPEPNGARRVLILLGGSDPDNLTLRVLQMLGSMVTTRQLDLTVIVGAANPHADSLRAFLADLSDNAVLLANPSNLPELMTRAHVAISAAGSTCWELACLGLPMLLITTAPNQRGIAARLEEMGLAVSFGWHEDFPKTDAQARLAEFLDDGPRRRRVSENGRLLFDGRGSGRAVDAMLGYPLTLRRATTEDARLLWDWANDSVVRDSAFSPEPIPWDGHMSWFADRLANANCQILIGLDGSGVPIGQVRFEGAAETATVDVSVASAYRGKGYSPRLIRLAVARLFDDRRWRSAQAWVKPANLASRRAFERAGFHRQGEKEEKGQPAIGYHVDSLDLP